MTTSHKTKTPIQDLIMALDNKINNELTKYFSLISIIFSFTSLIFVLIFTGIPALFSIDSTMLGVGITTLSYNTSIGSQILFDAVKQLGLINNLLNLFRFIIVVTVLFEIVITVILYHFYFKVPLLIDDYNFVINTLNKHSRGESLLYLYHHEYRHPFTRALIITIFGEENEKEIQKN